MHWEDLHELVEIVGHHRHRRSFPPVLTNMQDSSRWLFGTHQCWQKELAFQLGPSVPEWCTLPSWKAHGPIVLLNRTLLLFPQQNENAGSRRMKHLMRSSATQTETLQILAACHRRNATEVLDQVNPQTACILFQELAWNQKIWNGSKVANGFVFPWSFSDHQCWIPWSIAASPLRSLQLLNRLDALCLHLVLRQPYPKRNK